MRGYPQVFALLFVAACSDRPVSPPGVSAPEGSFLLSWSVSHPHWGTEALILRRDGTLRLLLADPAGAETAREVVLDASEIAALESRLREAHPCDLEPSTRAGKPNESRPTLTLRFSSVACARTQWFDEWRTSERARPVATIVAALRARVVHAE